VGVLPVSVLALAVALSAATGLRLSRAAPERSVADEIGCEYVSASRPQAGVSQETCSFRGNTVVILSLTRGPHALQDVPDNLALTPEGKPVVIGCQRRADCVLIHRQLGGELRSGPMLGVSVVID
jgi:hypothetical protein